MPAVSDIQAASVQGRTQRAQAASTRPSINAAIANENAIENITASESSIRDADVAAEVSAFTRSQILIQSGTALLAQADVLPQNALSVLG